MGSSKRTEDALAEKSAEIAALLAPTVDALGLELLGVAARAERNHQARLVANKKASWKRPFRPAKSW